MYQKQLNINFKTNVMFFAESGIILTIDSHLIQILKKTFISLLTKKKMSKDKLKNDASRDW